MKRSDSRKSALIARQAYWPTASMRNLQITAPTQNERMRPVALGAVQLVAVPLKEPVVERLSKGAQVAGAEDARVGRLRSELPEVLV